MTQEKTVFTILQAAGKLRTSELALLCLRSGIGVSSTGRYCRWMRERGIIKSYKAKADDKELTFEVVSPYITEKEWKANHSDELFDSCNSAENML